MKKYISLSVVLIASFSLFWVFIIELIDYYEFKTLPKQIVNDYSIVYIDPTYLVFYATFLFIPPYVWCVIKLSLWGKDSLGVSVKLLAVTTLLALIIAVPGQFIEYKRQESIAREHGFVSCPPFTLLSSTHIVEAMVKDLRYCTDDAINNIAKYGYFRELPIVNAYVNEVYQYKE
ncbi:hypothetical protein L3I74_000798 [Vibrio parahaemolyticus]|nr:hypothetical protein [Vibrio parahaemolyticus]EHJ9981000.1 hypothetical protein [Vibrio parahaemolyticus]EHR1165400.1 hypothetical protein [Vibrio parahaemolyticus]EIU7849026.1 hypothetical protein [Vibrio parahaemolyticus]ELA9431665.1 hypothetical protein [Vibrio parahaemolyticus]